MRYYYDPGLSDSGTGSGGTIPSTFDSGVVPNFYLPGTGDVAFPSGGAGVANFDGVGGTVSVTATSADYPQPAATDFDGSTAYTVDGPGTIKYQVTNGNTYISNSGAAVDIEANSTVTENNSTDQLYIKNSGSSNLTIGGTMAFSGSDETVRDTDNNSSDPTYGYTTSEPSITIHVDNTGGGTLNFNSTVTNQNLGNSTVTYATYPVQNGPAVLVTVNVGEFFNLDFNGGTSEFNGNLTGANTGVDLNSGSPTDDNLSVDNATTVLVDNGNFDRFQVNGGTLLTNGAVTVGATNSYTNNGTLGGATTDLSTFSGDLASFGGVRTLTAVAGGRVNFSGDLYGGGVGAGNDLVVDGGGVIALTRVYGNDYASQYNGGSNTAVGTEIANGTLLAENTQSGTSATGAGFNQNSTPTSSLGANNVVQIDNVTSPTKTAPLAVLGGNGYVLQQVVAIGANSSITPGDITPANLVTTPAANAALVPGATGTAGYIVTPGTLHLDNGLTASNGLTANFVLTSTPSTSSTVQLSLTSINPDNGYVTNGAPSFAFTLAGPVTINLYGTVNTADTYTLFSSTTGTPWDITTNSSDYTFTGVPTGYTANILYVADDASGNEALDVTFMVPEPSTWALAGLGALVLAGTARFRRLSA